MSINKVVERKTKKALAGVQLTQKHEEVLMMFRTYAESKKEELQKLFPTVIIGEFSRDVVGVSYSSSRTNSGHSVMGPSTFNITISTLRNTINIGYGANSVSGSVMIPITFEMTKPQFKRVFKQAIESLISQAYSPHSEKDWKVRKEITEITTTHRKVRRNDIDSNYLRDHAQMFQRGGTHDYYKMDGQLIVSAYGREVYEYVQT